MCVCLTHTQLTTLISQIRYNIWGLIFLNLNRIWLTYEGAAAISASVTCLAFNPWSRDRVRDIRCIIWETWSFYRATLLLSNSLKEGISELSTQNTAWAILYLSDENCEQGGHLEDLSVLKTICLMAVITGDDPRRVLWRLISKQMLTVGRKWHYQNSKGPDSLRKPKIS
jgi:hypothetical protein